MRPTIFAALLSLTAGAGYSQFSKDQWHEGLLVTVEADTLRGTLKYDEDANVVQVVENNVMKTCSSHTIFYFEIFDKILRNYRQFYSLPYAVSYNYEVPILFELLYEGPMSLLARETVIQEAVNSGSTYWGTGTTRNILAYTYYFLDKKGRISLFTGKKKDLIRILAKKAPQVKVFIKKNKLNVSELHDLVRVTAFYNSL